MEQRVRHLHSRITTVFEASRLVRYRFDELGPEAFDAWEIDPNTLLGACGIASYALSRVLKKCGVKNHFVMGRFCDPHDRGDHCWVEVPAEKLIIDITATQFKIPSAVHVTSTADPKYLTKIRNAEAVKELETWHRQSHITYPSMIDTVISDVYVQLLQSAFVML